MVEKRERVDFKFSSKIVHKLSNRPHNTKMRAYSVCHTRCWFNWVGVPQITVKTECGWRVQLRFSAFRCKSAHGVVVLWWLMLLLDGPNPFSVQNRQLFVLKMMGRCCVLCYTLIFFENKVKMPIDMYQLKMVLYERIKAPFFVRKTNRDKFVFLLKKSKTKKKCYERFQRQWFLQKWFCI